MRSAWPFSRSASKRVGVVAGTRNVTHQRQRTRGDGATFEARKRQRRFLQAIGAGQRRAHRHRAGARPIELDQSGRRDALDQSARVTGAQTEEVLLDAGYFDDGVIAATLERGVSMLCPDGQTPGMAKEGKVFPKSTFVYDACTDTYRCPAGQILILLKRRGPTEKTRAHGVYGGAACGDCPRRKHCTSRTERLIERYPEDTQRDALRQVMQQPQVDAVFGKRKAMVEPVFSHLRGQQGLSRFRRSGLQAVKREFALHVMAYNLSRAVALLRAFSRLMIASNLLLDGPRAIFKSLRNFMRNLRIEDRAIPALM